MSTLKVREADILRSIVDYLKLRRVFFWRQNAGGYKTDAGHFIHYGTKGVPDICVIKAGFIGLEVKRPGGSKALTKSCSRKHLSQQGDGIMLWTASMKSWHSVCSLECRATIKVRLVLPHRRMFLRRLPAIYDVVVCQVCLGASGNGPGRGDINARSAPARCLRLRLPIGRTPTRCAISPRQTFRRRCNVRSKASGYSGWDVLRRARSSRAVCDGSASNHVRSSSVTEASGSGRRRPRFAFGFARDVGRTSPLRHAVARFATNVSIGTMPAVTGGGSDERALSKASASVTSDCCSRRISANRRTGSRPARRANARSRTSWPIRASETSRSHGVIGL